MVSCGGFANALWWKWSEVTVGRQVRTLTGGGQNMVGSVAISKDGKRVVSGSADKLVQIWNVATGAKVSSFVGVRCGEVMGVI